MAAPPKKLKPKHLTMAALAATGMTDRQIAKELGCSHHTVKITRQSPLFQLEVTRLSRTQQERISNNYVDQVMQDGERNAKFLRKVRDGQLADLQDCDSADRMRFRLDASKTLFDRQMPKQKEGSAATPTVQVILQKNEQLIMHDALKDVGVTIPQLDDVIRQLEHDEQQALQAEADAATLAD